MKESRYKLNVLHCSKDDSRSLLEASAKDRNVMVIITRIAYQLMIIIIRIVSSR
jgi:hypothetical protein